MNAKHSAVAISVRQPWAWLIVNGFKPIENRTWYSTRRGPVLIHAGLAMTRDAHESCLIFCRSIGVLGREINGRRLIIPAYEELERGGIVGSATITACVSEHDSDWFTGDYGLVLSDAKPLLFHRCKGSLGFFNV